MAYTITGECTGCFACVGLCPNQAISGQPGYFRIEPFLCTECVGFAASSQCVDACALGAIVQLG
jgi:ferredoxin